MTVRRYDDPDAFLACVSPQLARQPATLAMFRSWSAALRREPGKDRHYLAVWRRDGRTGEAMQAADSPVVIGGDVEAARAFARDLAEDHRQLRGVVGPADACEAFASEWKMRTGCIATLRFRMRNHVLDALVMPPRPRGRMRDTGDDDIAWLVDAQLAFADEANLPDARDRLRRMIPERQARGAYRIWDDSGPVAFAGWSDAGAAVARIAPVYTMPDRRRRGYAAALVADLAAELRSMARPTIFLVTDVANHGANALYAKVGFRPLDEFCHFDLAET